VTAATGRHEPALVAVPGLLLDQRLWERQTPLLGHDREVQVPLLRRHASIAAMAHAVLAEAPERFALCGLSMGGIVALEIVRAAPERVTRLALLDTQARADTAESTAGRREMLDLAQRRGFEPVIEQLLPRLVHPRLRDDAPTRRLLHEMAETIGLEGFEAQQEALIGRIDQRPNLPAIACPTLVLCGRQDALTPVDRHEEMAAAIPDATLVVLPECGHLSPLERPDMVTAQLRAWLDG